MSVMALILITSTLCLNSRSHLDYSRIQSTTLAKKGIGDISTDGGGGGADHNDSTPVGNFPVYQDIYLGLAGTDGMVGRHGYINYNRIENKGKMSLGNITQMADPYSFVAADFTVSSTTTETYSIATTISVSLELMKGINVEAAIPGFASISSNTSIKSIFTIANTLTYMASLSTTFSTTYHLNPEAIEKAKDLNTDWAIGRVGEVYSITGEYFEARDWWWNHKEEVPGSRQTTTVYLVCGPALCVVYENGLYYTGN